MKKQLYILFLVLLATIQVANAQQKKAVYKKNVYFEFNKYDIRKADSRAFTAFLRAVKAQEGGYVIKLTGHTDNIDVDPYNDKLGMNRANAVKKYLVAKGVPADFIETYSKGEKVAVKDNSTDTGRALNRRVEMELYGTGAPHAYDGIVLQGTLYDADTKEVIKGDVKIYIEEPKEVDRDKEKHHLQVETYKQIAISSRTYNVYVAAEGYRAKSHTISIPAGTKKGTFTQDVYLNKLVIKKRFDYERIYFEPNKDVFRSIAYPELAKLLTFMNGDTNTIVEIRGHINYTKNRKPMNEVEHLLFYDLSLRRAIAVYNYLVKYGVNPARMSYRGMSNKEMVMPYARTLEESQRNMRVEILVLN